MTRIRLWLVIYAVVATSLPAYADTLRIGAAASTRDVLTAIITAYKSDTKQDVSMIFQSSSSLKRQIEAGARIDLIVSADQRIITRLREANLIEATSVKTLVGNELSLIVPTEGRWSWVTSLEDLRDPRIKKIALCDPSVPVGHYAQALLKAEVQDQSPLQRKIVKPDHVRAALNLVSTGAAQAGFVYRTDIAASNGRVRQVLSFARPGGQIISYPAAIISSSKLKDKAQSLLHFISQDPRATALWKQHGFLVPRTMSDH